MLLHTASQVTFKSDPQNYTERNPLDRNPKTAIAKGGVNSPKGRTGKRGNEKRKKEVVELKE